MLKPESVLERETYKIICDFCPVGWGFENTDCFSAED